MLQTTTGRPLWAVTPPFSAVYLTAQRCSDIRQGSHFSLGQAKVLLQRKVSTRSWQKGAGQDNNGLAATELSRFISLCPHNAIEITNNRKLFPDFLRQTGRRRLHNWHTELLASLFPMYCLVCCQFMQLQQDLSLCMKSSWWPLEAKSKCSISYDNYGDRQLGNARHGWLETLQLILERKCVAEWEGLIYQVS
jgi:hypothetical protein